MAKLTFGFSAGLGYCLLNMMIEFLALSERSLDTGVRVNKGQTSVWQTIILCRSMLSDTYGRSQTHNLGAKNERFQRLNHH